MNITRNDIDDLNALLQLELETEDYLPQVKASLKKIRKQASMKGFRPGMVPIGLVKSKYGQAVMVEEIEKIVGKGLEDYLKEQDLKILFRPILIPQKNMEFSVQEPTSFTFDYEIALEPAFELNYKDDTLTKYAIEMSEDFINEELNKLRKKFGTENEATPPLEEKDIINIRLEELQEDGLIKEGGATNETLIAIDLIKDADLQAEVMQLDLEGQVNINLEKAFDRKKADVLKFILDKKEEEAEGVGMDYQLTLLGVKRIEIADMTPEFFEQVYHDNSLDTEEKFMECFREDFEELLEVRSNERFKKDIFKHLLETVEMNLPTDFIEKFIEQNTKEAISGEQLVEYLKTVKWELIQNKIANENGVIVQRAEIEAQAMADIKQSFQQYRRMIPDNEEIKGIASVALKDEKFVRETHGRILEYKLFNVLVAQVKSESQSISFEDFTKLN